jgi:hypothetical protein
MVFQVPTQCPLLRLKGCLGSLQQVIVSAHMQQAILPPCHFIEKLLCKNRAKMQITFIYVGEKVVSRSQTQCQTFLFRSEWEKFK